MIKYIAALLLTVTATHAQQRDPYANAYADQRVKVFEQRKRNLPERRQTASLDGLVVS
jgi:hypothetical protein